MQTNAELTEQQYYGGLNRRFERRAALLRKMGFRYIWTEVAPKVTTGGFSRSQFGRVQYIPAALVAHAGARAFHAELARLLTH